MANKLLLEIVTPTRLVWSQEVELATAPGVDGEFGIMANHAPLLAALKIGEMRITDSGSTVHMAVSGGFCEVSSNKMTVLAEAAEKAEDIDVDRALKAKERAEKRLQEAAAGREEIDQARAMAALERALVRLKVARL